MPNGSNYAQLVNEQLLLLGLWSPPWLISIEMLFLYMLLSMLIHVIFSITVP